MSTGDACQVTLYLKRLKDFAHFEYKLAINALWSELVGHDGTELLEVTQEVN